MSVLWDKDWKYKIPFDKQLLADVNKFADTLDNTKAKVAMKYEIKFFKNIITIEEVFNQIQKIKDDAQFKNFAKTIKKNLTHILYIPKELEDYYRTKAQSLDKKYQEFVNFLITYGRTHENFPNFKLYYEDVLDVFYDKVMAKIRKYADQVRQPVKLKYINEYEVSTALNELTKTINSNPATTTLWGDSTNISYELKYNNIAGFGKFRSKLTSGVDNTFTVNAPDHKISVQELHNQYFTNVYPGYGNFVETQFADTTNRNIDFGANFVINGWATFAAWHIIPSTYTTSLKVTNSKIIKKLLDRPSKHMYSQLYMLLINTFDKDTAIKIFAQITQLPGKFESRFLGAIATEIVIDLNYAMNPKNYLARLQDVDITNFFTPLKKLK